MTRDELIAALEKAAGADRDLDADIACLLDGDKRLNAEKRGFDGRVWNDVEWDWISAPHYTASIDAALTLVPEGWRWSLDWTQRPPYQDCGRADLYAPGNGIKPADVGDVYAATPAIALCIAALKARTE